MHNKIIFPVFPAFSADIRKISYGAKNYYDIGEILEYIYDGENRNTVWSPNAVDVFAGLIRDFN